MSTAAASTETGVLTGPQYMITGSITEYQISKESGDLDW